jgi:mannose-1-phosphate guanylyltransferase/mannose-1-phosphate guanylyltransferase/mannose-6-phosphate isomerase
VVLSGNPTVVIGDKVINASEGEEFFVLKKTNHRIEASNSDVQILEIAFGDFDEDDIIRIEDVYGRVSNRNRK